MKKLSIFLTAAFLSISFASQATAAEQVTVTRDDNGKPSFSKVKVVEEAATVQAVDQQKRIVTLKGPGGNVFDIKAGDEVRNLAQVKAGDTVKVEYFESVAIEVLAPGEGPGGRQEAIVMERAKLGQKPGGAISGEVTVTAKIDAISSKLDSVTLRGPEGKTLKVKVENPDNLKNVKVGDDVVITLTEALAISVEGVKPGK